MRRNSGWDWAKALVSVSFCVLSAPACTGVVDGPGIGQVNPGATPGASGNSGAAAGAGAGAGAAAGAGSGDGSAAAPQCSADQQNAVPFRVLTRLNRVEYDNTARDLLGDTAHVPLSALPADFGDGAFDNNASALSIDPSLTQQFSQVAETLAQNAFAAGSPGRALVLSCQTTDDACARQVSANFAGRAWRRPAQTAEVDRLVALYAGARAAGFSFEEGLQTVVEAALLSPNFLFRPELDPTPGSNVTHLLNPYELATRLSYFLWSTTPDATLTAAAASGDLAKPDGLTRQVQRLWAAPNAEAFLQRFPGQWLRTQNVTVAHQPSTAVFPAFNPDLKAAMEGETARFMKELITTDVDFMQFIDAKFTYVNATLAQFYGLPGQFGADFQRVDLSTNAQRGGILTQASFLTVASPAERTSPVSRGQWVLARLLNAPPPPPPANVPPLAAQTASMAQTMRQRMQAHATNPSCAACHTLMDPIGFGLENFDGIGHFRATDGGAPVDASGALPGGKTFNGALELEAALKSDPRVPRAVVKYLLSYALGREVGDQDRCLLDALTTSFQSVDKNRMKALVARVATLPVMQSRRGAP